MDDRRLTEPVKLVLRAAETVRRERGDTKLRAEHLLAGFARRHGAMLARLAGGIDIERYVGDKLRTSESDGGQQELLIEQAVARAKAEGANKVDLRHLAASLLSYFELRQDQTEGEQDSPAVVEGPSKPTPALDSVGRDLTALARVGQLSPVVAREAEIDEVIEVLCRRFKRNPLLVGPPGVGKTAVVEGLAQRVASGRVPNDLRAVRIVELAATGLLARSPSLHELSELVRAIVSEASQPKVVLFIDEFQSAVEAGGRDLGIAGQMKPALSRGQIACIGALTEADYYRTVQSDPALDRRFQPVRVNELSVEATTQVLRTLAPSLVEGSRVKLSDSVFDSAVRLSGRFLRNRYFPDKAIDLLDRAVARAKRTGVSADEALVADVIADMTGLPLGREARDLSERLKGLAAHLRSRVIGQDEAIEALVSHLAVKVQGLDLKPERPNGVFLFTGPTGVGKTEMARALAEYLFGSKDRMMRLDMSEYREEHYVAKLVGSPPGYVGYEQGAPLLEEIMSRPFAVVLLDEIEKAHPAAHHLFLQVFDDGFLTSGAGNRVYFSDATIIMTANIDLSARDPVGFFSEGQEDRELDALDDYFPREFINRIDAVCPFRELTREDVRRIVEEVMLPAWLSHRERSDIQLEITDEALELIAVAGYSKEFGARELHRVFEDLVLVKLVDMLAPGEEAALVVLVEDGNISVERKGKG
jgi:ATP-dependent Clp protease ATP-binding subunit ClpC